MANSYALFCDLEEASRWPPSCLLWQLTLILSEYFDHRYRRTHEKRPDSKHYPKHKRQWNVVEVVSFHFDSPTLVAAETEASSCDNLQLGVVSRFFGIIATTSDSAIIMF
jgi:hypothetical protein